MNSEQLGDNHRSYRDYDDSSEQFFSYRNRFIQGPYKKKPTDDVDADADKHGNWRLKHAKRKLDKFMRERKDKTRYKFEKIGPGKLITAQLTLNIPELTCSLVGSGTDLNKHVATEKCSLSLVWQLFDKGIIEAFTGVEKEHQMNPFYVTISPALEKRVYDALKLTNVKPVPIPKNIDPENGFSILSSTILDDFSPSTPHIGGVIPWEPPLANWNAWTSCYLDEGPLSTATLDAISRELEVRQRNKSQNDLGFRKMIQEREALPIASQKTEITQKISKHSVVIIRGRTSYGNSTHVCQYILDEFIESGRGAYCNILVAQPRRIPALFVAERVSNERSETLGQSVGYSVLYESCLPRPYGAMLFSTVDVLLKKLETGLRGISHIIVDDIHEREINTDVFLIILRDMVRKYPDLRVILMSAAIDTTIFSSYFDNCPVLDITETLFLVEEYFLEDCIELLNFIPPLPANKRKNEDKEGEEPEEEDDIEENFNLLVSDKYSTQTRESMAMISERTFSFELLVELLTYIKNLNVPGVILMFLSGANIIFTLFRRLKQHPTFGGTDYLILPLLQDQPREDQRKVFAPVPSGVTKIILTTDVAENSFPMSDVVYVLNYCKTKVETFVQEKNMVDCETTWASRTNMKQRKGRAGQNRPGHCFHLCSRSRYETLEEYITPEVYRKDLHEIALTIKMLQLGSTREFFAKAITPPPADSVADAEDVLRDLNCTDDNYELTPLGNIVAKLPIKPRLGKMMIFGCIFSCADALAVVATSGNDYLEVFTQPYERRRLTYQQVCFSGPRFSDHIALLNAFQAWEKVRLEGVAFEKSFCNAKKLSMQNLRTIWEAKNQLIQQLSLLGFPDDTMEPRLYQYSDFDPNLDMVIALTTLGLYPNIAYHLSKRRVVTADNKTAVIHKTSVNCSNRELNFSFPFFVYHEMVKSQAVSCRHMTMVTPIHLLLFGSRKVEYIDSMIRLDDLINLNMEPRIAAAVVALRPALESFVVRAAREPDQLLETLQQYEEVISVVRELCELNAGDYTVGRRGSLTTGQIRGYHLTRKRHKNDMYGGGYSYAGRRVEYGRGGSSHGDEYSDDDYYEDTNWNSQSDILNPADY